MARILIDNNGALFHAKGTDGEPEFTEITDYFWKQLVTMARQLLISPAGGSLVITVPEHATSAEADLTLNPVLTAAKHIEESIPAMIAVSPSEGNQEPQNRTLLVEASGNGFSALLSAQETYRPTSDGIL